MKRIYDYAMERRFTFLVNIFVLVAAVRSEPVISAPTDFSVGGCDPDTSPSQAGQASGNSSAACEAKKPSVISYRDYAPYVPPSGFRVFERLWLIRDGCSRTVNDTQVIRINIPKPVLNLPNDVNSSCTDTLPDTTGLPFVVSQPCPEHSITFTYTDTTLSGSCPDSKELIKRTFTLRESWGRTNSHEQHITLYPYAPPDVTCMSDSFHVDITRDNYPYLSPDRMYLNDPSCVASGYNSTHVSFTIPLHSCGTVRHVTSDELIFENKVSAPVGSVGDAISLWRDVEFLVNCSYQRRVTLGDPSYTVPTNGVQVEEAGYGNFTFFMLLYQSNLYNRAYGDADFPLSVSLRELLYLELKVKSSQSQLALFVDTCKARSALSANSVDFTFISDGCVVASMLRYNYRLSSRQRFSMRAFQYLSKLSTVYLQCEVLVCHVNDTDSRCSSGCRSRRRREVDGATKNSRASETYTLSLGPIMQLTTDESPSNQGSEPAQQEFNMIPAVIGTASGIVVIVIFCCVFILFVLRRKRKKRKIIEMRANRALDAVESDVSELKE